MALTHIERKWLFNRNLAATLPLKFDESIEMLKNSWIFKSFNQKEKFQLSAQRKLFSPPPNKNFSGTKLFEGKLTGICRHWFSKCSENADLGRLEMVQCKMFFLTPTKIILLAVLQEYTFYTVEWFESCKMREVFWARLYCKIFFASFRWLSNFLPDNLKLIDKL